MEGDSTIKEPRLLKRQSRQSNVEPPDWEKNAELDQPHFGSEARRKLKNRHIQLIGIGGTIGTALFVQIGIPLTLRCG